MLVRVFGWIGILTGLGAAIFWLWSAMIPIPKIDLNWIGEAPLFFGAIKKQSELNAIAAICAAVAVLSEAIVLGRKKH